MSARAADAVPCLLLQIAEGGQVIKSLKMESSVRWFPNVIVTLLATVVKSSGSVQLATGQCLRTSIYKQLHN